MTRIAKESSGWAPKILSENLIRSQYVRKFSTKILSENRHCVNNLSKLRPNFMVSSLTFSTLKYSETFWFILLRNESYFWVFILILMVESKEWRINNVSGQGRVQININNFSSDYDHLFFSIFNKLMNLNKHYLSYDT